MQLSNNGMQLTRSAMANDAGVLAADPERWADAGVRGLAPPAAPIRVSAEEASRPAGIEPTRQPRRGFCMPSSGRLKA